MSKFLQIGLLLGMHYEYNRQILKGLVSYARPSKPWVLHFITIDEAAPPEGLHTFDGFLGNLSKRSVCNVLVPLGKPMVNISNLFTNSALPRVGIDDRGLGRNVAQYFIERGFRNFAFTGFDGHGYSMQREQGYAEELARHGFTHSSQVAHISPTGVPEYNVRRLDTMRQWILSLPRPVAILGANDTRAWEVVEICRDAGVSVPEEVAVVGADNDPAVCMMAYPPISSVATAGDRIGYEAARILDEMLQGQKVSLAPLLIPDKGIVTRQSSDILAIQDRELSAAVRFVRENYANRIGVNDIVRAVPIARRSLERKFRAMLRRSPLEEIRRVRLERVRELLANTDLSMPAIAARCGFESAVRLTTVFREEFKTTPTQYRRQFRMREQGEAEDDAPVAPRGRKPARKPVA